MSRGAVSKKTKSNLRRLTGVLRELLDEKDTTTNPETSTETVRDGVVYIMSKENRLIPKLTDEEVMERHRMADENMKRVWAQIIHKYESVEDQGDVVDLHTGEIIEDNGHLRSLGDQHTFAMTDTTSLHYESVMSDLLNIKDDPANSSVWEDEQELDQKMISDSKSELEEQEEDYDESSESDHENADSYLKILALSDN